MTDELYVEERGERVTIDGKVHGKLEVVAHENGVLVLKEAGRHYYSGQGRPFNYAPATFRVLRVERSESLVEGTMGREVGIVHTCIELVSWPVRP